MKRLSTLLLIAALTMLRVEAADFSVARVQAVVATFLGVETTQVAWPEIAKPQGPYERLKPIRLRLPDPPTLQDDKVARSLLVGVDSRDYYVSSAMWQDNAPPDEKCNNLVPLAQGQAFAEEFTRQHFKPWPNGMKLVLSAQGYSGQPNPVQTFRWEQRVGDVRCGTFVTVTVNPCVQAKVYVYTAYIAPAISPGVVKISREQALKIASEEAAKRGHKNPRFTKVDLYLSEQHLEQPHWHMVYDYENRNMGFLGELFIDAVTGKLLTPVYN